jgi:hypothetical protein
MKKAKLSEQVPAEVWQIAWNVNCQAVESSAATLKFLAPYVFKVAISNSSIVGLHDRTVLIRYRKPHSERSRILALDVIEFIRRFLQHVLPTGFMKIRYYGFMNPNCRIALDQIRGLIELSYGFALDRPVPEVEPRRQSTCPSCLLREALSEPQSGEKFADRFSPATTLASKTQIVWNIRQLSQFFEVVRAYIDCDCGSHHIACPTTKSYRPKRLQRFERARAYPFIAGHSRSNLP